MDHEIGKGILRMLFDELLAEVPPEALTRIAQKVSAAIHLSNDAHDSSVRKQLEIDDLEMAADVANRRGNIGQALRLQSKAEDLRFRL